jgi:pyruvate kinase
MEKNMPHKRHWNQRTKIVCTLGPSSSTTTIIERMIRAGMNVARLNLSHGHMEEHARYIREIRNLNQRLESDTAILMDLPGPKYRIGDIKNFSVILKAGSELILSTDGILGDETKVPINLHNLYRDVKTGSMILIDDGAIRLKVMDIRGTDVICKVMVGGILTPGRGVVVPGSRGSESFLTPKLKEYIEFAIQQKPDYLALSFVSCADDVLQVRQILNLKNSSIPLISKIERKEAVKNVDHILAVSDGIMVARGDLGVEIPLKEIPIVQKKIIRKSNIAGKAVITATQMLESMVHFPRPTRAEVTDVANAIIDGTDAIMLSAETSVGKYPVQSVKMMYQIAVETERNLNYEQLLKDRGSWLEQKTDELISYNACYTAYQIKASAIVAYTQSGSTARRVSKYRSRIPVIAITPNKEIAGRLALYWGVQTFQIDNPENVDELFIKAADLAKELGVAKTGDLIVITGGIPLGRAGTTNLLKVHEIS